MKKYLIILFVALVAFGFTGCFSDSSSTSSKADLKWSNDAGANVKDIKWVSSGKTDQSWDGTFAQGTGTDFKGISELAGQGDCIDNGGSPATISLKNTSTGTTVATGAKSATIVENAAAILVISGTTAK